MRKQKSQYFVKASGESRGQNVDVMDLFLEWLSRTVPVAVHNSQGFEHSAPPSTCAVLDRWVDSRSYGQHVPGRWSTLAAGDSSG